MSEHSLLFLSRNTTLTLILICFLLTSLPDWDWLPHPHHLSPLTVGSMGMEMCACTCVCACGGFSYHFSHYKMYHTVLAFMHFVCFINKNLHLIWGIIICCLHELKLFSSLWSLNGRCEVLMWKQWFVICFFWQLLSLCLGQALSKTREETGSIRWQYIKSLDVLKGATSQKQKSNLEFT